jgi:hypothetical protein
MSSAEPAGDSSTVEVKAEESAGSEGNATVTVADPGPTFLAKQELEQLEGILKRLTDYRDEEYVPRYSSTAAIRCRSPPTR